jgi:hypothetical protein
MHDHFYISHTAAETTAPLLLAVLLTSHAHLSGKVERRNL